MENQEKELLTLELQINKLIQDFQVKSGHLIGVINEDYMSFDDDRACDGERGSIIQLILVP